MIRESLFQKKAAFWLEGHFDRISDQRENGLGGQFDRSSDQRENGPGVTSTSSVTDGESSVTGQKKQARRPDGWSLSLSE